MAVVVAMKVRFLALYATTGTISGTAAALQWPTGDTLSVDLVKAWRDRDERFAAGMMEARVRFVDSLETEAHRRAVLGVTKVVYWHGEPIGFEVEYSDALLTTLLKANAPDKYRERVDISIDVDREIAAIAEQFSVTIEEARAEYAQIASARKAPLRLVSGQ